MRDQDWQPAYANHFPCGAAEYLFAPGGVPVTAHHKEIRPLIVSRGQELIARMRPRCQRNMTNFPGEALPSKILLQRCHAVFVLVTNRGDDDGMRGSKEW